jgi:hypothetical protein
MDILLKLTGDYYDQIQSGLPNSQAKLVLGSKYRAKESDTTMSIPRLKKLREYKVSGKKYLFTQHLTIGTSRNSAECIQVYFRMVESLIHIAYIGPHLEVSSS